ncbi:MAG: ATP-binding protein [Synergistaceae bacterium]|jgi:hypothetical protein|nr:ATP-binding protein [Synergistaceae bacterium]
MAESSIINNPTNSTKIPPIKILPRERGAILQSLAAGVVPRIGLHHIQVGRKDETTALLRDLERVEDGGAAVRFVIGPFGTGKSFFLNLTRTLALEKKFVVMQADLTPARRLSASAGQAAALYTELTRSMAVRSKPEGGALPGVLERWLGESVWQGEKTSYAAQAPQKIREKLKPLLDRVGGYVFADVLCRYLEGYLSGADELQEAALRWFCGEYATRTEAREALGVRSIVTDRDLYDYLKLWGAFVRLAGYEGLLVCLDEMGVLSHRLNNAPARNANYEVLLQILNDCLQGNVSGIGFVFAGTDAFLDDPRRGLMSYGALAGRLAANPYGQMGAKAGLKDFLGPVIRLKNLSPEDLYLLLHNIRSVFALGDPAKYLVPDEALHAFIQRCAQTLGASFYQTPRDASKAFVGFLSLLEQNPGVGWRSLLGNVPIEPSLDLSLDPSLDPSDNPSFPSDGDPGGQDDELTRFILK